MVKQSFGPRRSVSLEIQYCAKVMQAKCANFVLCSSDFSKKVRWKVHLKFHGVSIIRLNKGRSFFKISFS